MSFVFTKILCAPTPAGSRLSSIQASRYFDSQHKYQIVNGNESTDMVSRKVSQAPLICQKTVHLSSNPFLSTCVQANILYLPLNHDRLMATTYLLPWTIMNIQPRQSQTLDQMVWSYHWMLRWMCSKDFSTMLRFTQSPINTWSLSWRHQPLKLSSKICRYSSTPPTTVQQTSSSQLCLRSYMSYTQMTFHTASHFVKFCWQEFTLRFPCELKRLLCWTPSDQKRTFALSSCNLRSPGRERQK